MDSLPHDLIPLPTQPWDQRPVSVPLDVEECRTAIWRSRGNITQAAVVLKVPSARLRKFVANSPYLQNEVREAVEQLVDIAQNVVYDALTDTENPGRQDSMAKYVLSSQGKGRGWNTSGGGAVTVNNNNGGNIIIQWGDGEAITGDDSENAQIIEGEVVDG